MTTTTLAPAQPAAVSTDELVALRARLTAILGRPSLQNARAQSVIYYLIESEIQRNAGVIRRDHHA